MKRDGNHTALSCALPTSLAHVRCTQGLPCHFHGQNTSGSIQFQLDQKVICASADKIWHKYAWAHARLYITTQGSVVAISLHRLAHPGVCCICDFSRKSRYITIATHLMILVAALTAQDRFKIDNNESNLLFHFCNIGHPSERQNDKSASYCNAPLSQIVGFL